MGEPSGAAERPRAWLAEPAGGEPLRGVVPGARFTALPGIERVRAWSSGAAQLPPLCHLTGARVSQVEPGGVALALPSSPWLRNGLDIHVTMDLLSALSSELAGLTVVPAGSRARLVALNAQAMRMARAADGAQRSLATVLFTDIVASTERSVALGDTAWRELLGAHQEIVRSQLEIFRGHEVKTTGDGFLATFDSPARAVQCARAIRDRLQPRGLQIRAALHTGELERTGGDIAGIAVHIASRILTTCAANEILVSSTVRDLATGSGLRLEDRGLHALKGLEDEWRLVAVRD